MPFGSVIGPLTVWLTRRDRDPFIDQAPGMTIAHQKLTAVDLSSEIELAA